jgi:hypothetical protein
LEKDYPALLDAEEWERDHFKRKGIYSGVSSIREKTAMSRMKRYSDAENNAFFVTE